MSRTERDTTRVVRSWLEEGVTVLPDRVLDAVEESLHATPQRRGGWLARHFMTRGTNRLRFGFAAAVVAAAILAGLSVLPRDVGGPPTPTATPTSTATPTLDTLPTGTPASLVLGEGQTLDAGTYALTEGFPVNLTFTIRDGWETCSAGEHEQGVCPSGPDSGSRGISFLIIENVVADPCGSDAMVEPPVGPSVDDLVAAIADLEGFESSTPVEVTVDGYSGMQLEVIAPFNPGCDIRTWATADRLNGVSSNEHNLLRILDVAGTRVMIAAAYPPDVTADERSEMVGIMDSVRIDE